MQQLNEAQGAQQQQYEPEMVANQMQNQHKGEQKPDQNGNSQKEVWGWGEVVSTN